MGAGHRDHVEKALADGVPRGRDVGDARGVEHRQLDLALEGADLRSQGAMGEAMPGMLSAASAASVSMRP